MLRKIRMPREAATTRPGFRNDNGQIVVRDTGWPSETFAGQRVYHLRCQGCAHEYGANGCDIHARLCPSCQGGVKGEPLREAGPIRLTNAQTSRGQSQLLWHNPGLIHWTLYRSRRTRNERLALLF